tara:strand:- start:609 stop:1427 length:819 start_codon:yes stop_codon:yes gene_type:complete
MKQKTYDQGYLTFAQGTQYLKCAYLLALSVKTYCSINNFAIVVDDATDVPQYMQKVFDEIIVIPTMNPFWNEYLAWELTPFKETFKLESDMLITSNIDHWWYGVRLKNICFTTKVCNYRGEVADDSKYRKMWYENYMLNAYNGCMYFRHCEETKHFFDRCKVVVSNFNLYKNNILKNCRHDIADTDLFMSIVGTEIGQENFYVPTLDYPTFTHMKQYINNFTTEDWRDACSWALTDDKIFLVNGYAQTKPFHYHHKDFCTKELIERYEQFVL